MSDTNGFKDIFVHDRATHVTERVSISSVGEEANEESLYPTISADGRYVAFHSSADNLIDDDTNGTSDIFVHDRWTGMTERVSVSSSGEEGNNFSYEASISADASHVVFASMATNLIISDTNQYLDIFVHHRLTGETERVSINSSGEEANSDSFEGTLSADGRFVAFLSQASNLVINGTNDKDDVFVHDRQTGITERVNVSSTGQQSNAHTYGNAILSQDGRFVVFQSWASNLVPCDTRGWFDIFVHDRQFHTTERVSVNGEGDEAEGDSIFPAVSGDGRYVVFTSYARNLVFNDTNNLLDVFVRDRGMSGNATPTPVPTINPTSTPCVTPVGTPYTPMPTQPTPGITQNHHLPQPPPIPHFPQLLRLLILPHQLPPIPLHRLSLPP